MDHELVLFTKGRCVVEVGQESFDCPADSFIIVPPGRLHITRNAAAPCYRHCFHFDWDYWGPNPKPPVFVFSPTGFGREQLRLAPGFVPPGVRHGRFAQSPAALNLVQTLEFEWLAGRRGACRPLLLQLLLMLLGGQEAITADPPLELALRAKALLDSAERDVSVQELLETLGCSYAYLCRVFKRHFGLPPLKYLNAARLERAKVLLRDPTATARSVAFQLGFRDAAYFGRCFRQYAGTTPATFAGKGGKKEKGKAKE
jgi:AraC-like DNA-binding protein